VVVFIDFVGEDESDRDKPNRLTRFFRSNALQHMNVGFKVLRSRHEIESISPLGRLQFFRKGSSDNPSIPPSGSLQLFDLIVSIGVGLSPDPIGICISDSCRKVGSEKAFGVAFEISLKKVCGNIHFQFEVLGSETANGFLQKTLMTSLFWIRLSVDEPAELRCISFGHELLDRMTT
jgi:hypothetical protein